MLPSPFQDKIHSFRPEDVLILYALGKWQRDEMLLNQKS